MAKNPLLTPTSSQEYLPQQAPLTNTSTNTTSALIVARAPAAGGGGGGSWSSPAGVPATSGGGGSWGPAPTPASVYPAGTVPMAASPVIPATAPAAGPVPTPAQFANDALTPQANVQGQQPQAAPSGPPPYRGDVAPPPAELYNLQGMGKPNDSITGTIGADGRSTDMTRAPTAGQIYGSTGDAALDAAYAAQRAQLEADMQPVNEDAIRNKTMQRFQAEIDSLNQYYAEKKAQQLALEQPRFDNNLGSDAAIQSRRGLLGSTFGGAQTDRVLGANAAVARSISEAVDAEKLAAIQAVRGKVDAFAQKEIDEKLAAKRAGPDALIKNLTQAAARKEAFVSQYVSDIINSGLELTDAEIAETAKKLGTTAEAIKAKYNAAKKEAAKADYKAPISVAAGSSIFDPVTGKFVGTAPAKPETGDPDVVNFSDGTTRQYNQTTKTWDVLSTKKEDASDKKVVKINGVDYVQNADGTFSKPSVPEEVQARSDLQNRALTSAQALLDKFDTGSGTSAVGGSSFLNSFGFGLLPGTENRDFKTQFNNVKSLLALDDVKLLKGQGAVSDAERRLLAEASSKLDLAQSETEFRAALADIVNVLGKAKTAAPAAAAPVDYGAQIQTAIQNNYTATEIVNTLKSNPALSAQIQTALDANYSPEEILQTISSQRFNQVGGDTNQATNGAAKVSVSGGKEVPAAAASLAIQTLKPENAYGGQCGAFVHQIVADYPYGLNGINEKEAIINVPRTQTPQVGDVMIQRIGGKYGHVAVVAKVNPDGTVTLTESNYYDKTKPERVTNTRKVALDDPSVSGYFRGNLKSSLVQYA